MLKSTHPRYAWILTLSTLILIPVACQQAPVVEEEVAVKIPVTTTSEEARALFLKGRELSERLRGTDAHDYFLQAVELDPLPGDETPPVRSHPGAAGLEGVRHHGVLLSRHQLDSGHADPVRTAPQSLPQARTAKLIDPTR